LQGEIRALLAILAAAFALRVLLALLLPNIHHSDEVFQYLEQGHRLAFGYGVVPWEYRDGTRSWLLPGFLGGLMWLTAALGGGAAAYLAVIAAVLSAISLSIVAVAWLWARRLAGPVAALYAAAITATWFELVYFGAKPLTEALAASALFAGAFLLSPAARPHRSALVAAGVLLGLAGALRVHLAPAILVIALAGCFRRPGKDWLACGIGGLLVAAASGVLDWATWGYPFASYWANVEVNLLHDKASQYGISVWYAYIALYVVTWSGFLVPLVLLALAGARRAPMLLVVPLVIVASHSAIAHKEYRFVLPALPFVLLAAAIGTADFIAAVKRAGTSFDERRLLAAALLVWTATSAVLMFGDRFRTHLTRSAAEIKALASLRMSAPPCGLGLISVPWYYGGGYTYLHRNIPIYPIRSRDDPSGTSDAFDVAIAEKDAPLPPLGYRLERCYSGTVCVFRRSGTCVDRPDRMVNEVLRRQNE
jgi:hypothetical protein